LPATLKDLEISLRDSHSEEVIGRVEAFSKALKDTDARLEIFNADRGLLRAPILLSETQGLGFDLPDDQFALLQGDVVSTESAFHLGERITGHPKYIVLSSSCDLVPERRSCAALLRVKEIRSSEENAVSKLSLLLKFTRRNAMFLPALPNDADDILCNAIDFDGICQIRSGGLAPGAPSRLSHSGRLENFRVSYSSGTCSRNPPRREDALGDREPAPTTRS
jgi:hypothetical protein